MTCTSNPNCAHQSSLTDSESPQHELEHPPPPSPSPPSSSYSHAQQQFTSPTLQPLQLRTVLLSTPSPGLHREQPQAPSLRTTTTTTAETNPLPSTSRDAHPVKPSFSCRSSSTFQSQQETLTKEHQRVEKKMPPTPTSSAPCSPTHKRRRTDPIPVSVPASPASNLRRAVRVALAEESSPTARSRRLYQVYDTYRRRAMQSTRARRFDLFADDEEEGDGADDTNNNSNNNNNNEVENENCAHNQNNVSSNNGENENINQQIQTCHNEEIANNIDDNTNTTDINQSQLPIHSIPTVDTTTTTTDATTSDTSAVCVQSHSHSHTYARAPLGVFPGVGARPGCSHYSRSCWIKAACCGNYYACRRCHDENETHEIDRHATKLVACVSCGDSDQPVSSKCRTCSIQFARYFCSTCVFYDDREGHKAYHCEGCGICRVGEGLGIDHHHCDRCGNCVPIESKDDHPCRERALDSNCPICTEYLATSTERIISLNCGHYIHIDCLNKHTVNSYTCPICYKSVRDMSDSFRELEARLDQEVMPKEYEHKMSKILCHDCDLKCDVRFHFIFHKCSTCNGYNTRVLSQYDQFPPSGNVARNNVNGTSLEIQQDNGTSGFLQQSPVFQ